MSWNYKDYLHEQIERFKHDIDIGEYCIRVIDEQMFVPSKMEADCIYVVIKYLSNNVEFQGKSITQPVQLLILTEQDRIQFSLILFSKLAKELNWSVTGDETQYVKQQYTEPVVLSNFNEISYGYRSVLYMSSTLFIMKDIIDVKNLKIDNKDIQTIGFQLTYTMTGNTQQKPSDYISTTVKSVSTLSCSFTQPLFNNDLSTKVLGIMNGTNTGNENFTCSFDIGSSNFSINLKLVSSQINTAPNSVPSLMVGFML